MRGPVLEREVGGGDERRNRGNETVGFGAAGGDQGLHIRVVLSVDSGEQLCEPGGRTWRWVCHFGFGVGFANNVGDGLEVAGDS